MMTRFVRSIRFWGAGVWLLGLVAFPVQAGDFVLAYDASSELPYTETGVVADGSNGGFGFGPWELVGSGTVITFLLGDSSENGRESINDSIWGAFALQAQPDPAFLDARRTLAAPMEPGQRFQFAMNLSWFGGERGFILYEGAYTNDRLKISHGGSDALWVNGEQAFANVYNQALTVTVEAVSSTVLGLTIEGDATFTTNLTVAGLPDRFKFYYSNSAGDSANELNYWIYFNRLTLLGDQPTQTVTTVAYSGPGSLRDAVASSPPGGVVNFESFLAGQTISLGSELVIDKDLTIDGSGLLTAPILSGGNSNRVLLITNATVVLDTLTLADGVATNSGAWNNRGGAILSRNADLTVLNSTLRDNLAQFGGGAFLDKGTSRFVNCTIAHNTAQTTFPNGGGFYISGSNVFDLVHSTVASNRASNSGGGVGIELGVVTLENSVISGNGPSFLNIGSDVSGIVTTLAGTNFIGNTAGATLPAGTVLTGNPLLGPLQDNGGPTWTMEPATNSPLLEAAGPSVIDRDQRGAPRPAGLPNIGAVEDVTNTTYFVAVSNPTPQWPYITWATAATNIQGAIDVTSPGNTVLVSNGVYQTGGRKDSASAGTNRVMINKPITVESVNGPQVTIIKGAWDPVTTNGDASVRGVYLSGHAMLVGFMITNGTSKFNGGGLYAVDETAVVSNCIFTGNSANWSGGGAYRGTIYRSSFIGNRAQYGGGAYPGFNDGSLNHCVLIENLATSFGGGGAVGDFNHCLFVGNVALGQGGGGAAQANLFNCTVVGNTAVNAGGGVEQSSLRNSIVIFNESQTTTNHNYIQSGMENSCSTPLPASGTGNITNDPLFVSLATTNLQLSAGSPARDMGNNANAPSGPDLAGNPRIVHGYVDMGAFEFQGGTGQGDFDGDGFGNGDEGVAGTDFNDMDDVFSATSFSLNGLVFDSVTGRVYAVDYTENLPGIPQIWTEFTNSLPGTGGPLVINDPQPGANRAYRVRVALAP